jgi:hypothetical protein
MNDVDRRSILQGAIGAISLAALGPSAAPQAEAQQPQEDPATGAGKKPL